MKALKIFGGIVLLIISLNASSQKTAPLNQTLAVKSQLFSRLPERLPVSSTGLEKIFSASSSGTLKITLSNSVTLEGVILERVQRTPRIVTVNMKLLNYDGALLTISRMTDEDAQVTYMGRIINIKYGDALVLSTENSQVFIAKEKQSVFMVE
jgi:hypothetical protein